MNDPQMIASPAEARALGRYALKRTGRTEVVKSKFIRHVFEKKHHHFNPFDYYARHTRSRADRLNKKASSKTGNSKKELGKLKEVAQEAQEVLLCVNSVFPFSLFPDTITLDRHKLTIVYRTFFWVEQTVSVSLTDIKNIQADMGPFFGSLTVTSDHFINNTQTVNYLWRKDVKKIQELVQGAMVAKNEQIDITKVEPKELHNLLIDLGRGHSGATA